MPRYSAFVFVLLVAGSAQAAEKTFDRTFAVAPGGSLIVDADGGAVQVSGNDANQVVVHMSLSGTEDELSKMQADAVQKDNGVTVTLHKTKRSWFSWWIWRSEEKIEVTVPRHYGISVRTGGGSVTLQDTIGSASLHTSGGDITARNLTGNAELRTSGGSIDADTIRGDVDADTSGGDVHLLRIDGKIRGNTSGGSVRCSLAGANRGISATTSGGDIEVIVPRATTAKIDASTDGGTIKTQIPVTSTLLDDNKLQGAINGGGEPIYAHTSGGSISLRAEN